MANLRTTIILDAKTRVKGAFDKTKGYFNGLKSDTNNTNTEMSTLGRTAQRLQTTLLGFVGISILSNVAQSVIKVSDNMKLMQGRLQVVTGSIAGAVDASKRLVEVSLETGTSLVSNTSLFVRLNRPLKAMGKNAEFATKFVGFMAKGLRVSGASAGEAASVIRQMSQALASGVLRGDEFNSVSENGTAITIALGKSLNKTQGELRKMAEGGLLTSEVVIEALGEQFEAMNSQFANIPKTVDASVEKVKTSFSVMVGASEGVNSATDKLIGGLEFLSANMTQITAVGVTLAQILGTTLLGSITTLTAAKIKQSIASEKLAAAERQYQNVAGMSAIKAKEFAVAMAKTKAAIDSNITAVQSNIKSLGQNINVERLAAKVTERRLQVKLKEAAALTKVATNLQKHTVLVNNQNVAYQKSIAIEKQLVISKDRLKVIQDQILRNGTATQAQINAVNRLLSTEKALTDQLTASKLRLTVAQNATNASSNNATAAIRNQNDISRRHQVSLQNLNAITSRSAVSQGFFARNLASTGVALRNVGAAARVGAAGMLSFTKTIAVGLITFEAITAVYDLSTAFLTLTKSEKKLAKADKDLKAKLKESKLALIEQARVLGISTEGIDDNFSAVKKLVDAEIERIDKLNTQNELTRAKITQDRLLKNGTDALTEAQFALSNSLIKGETSILKINKAASVTLDTFKKWDKEVGGNLDAIKDKLNGLSDLEFAKFEKSVLDSMNAGIEVTKEMQRVMDSLSLSKTERAFRALGLIADTELKRIAATHQKAFDTIVESGVATESQLSEAFTTLAEKMIKANGGVADAALIAEAKQRNVTIKINESGKASVLTSEQLTQMGTAGAAAADKITSSLSAPITSLHNLRISARKAREDYNNLLSSGEATGEELKIAWDKVQTASNNVTKALKGTEVQSKKTTTTIVKGSNESSNAQSTLKGKVQDVTKALRTQEEASKSAAKAAKASEDFNNKPSNRSLDSNGIDFGGSNSESTRTPTERGRHTSNADQVNARRQNRADDINKRNNANIEATDDSGRRANKEILTKFTKEQKEGFNLLTEEQKKQLNDEVNRSSRNQALNIAAERQNRNLRNQVIDGFLIRAEATREAEVNTKANIERRTKEKEEEKAERQAKRDALKKKGEEDLARRKKENEDSAKARADKKAQDEIDKKARADKFFQEQDEIDKRRAQKKADDKAEKQANKLKSKARQLASKVLLDKEKADDKAEERIARQNKLDAVSDAQRLIRLDAKNASVEQRAQSQLDVDAFRKRREELRIYEEKKKQRLLKIDNESFKQRTDRLKKELADARARDLENEKRLQKLNSEVHKTIQHGAKIDTIFFNDLDDILKKRSTDTAKIIRNLKKGQ